MFPIVDYVRPAVEHFIELSSIGFAPLFVCFLVKWEIGCKCSKAKEESAWSLQGYYKMSVISCLDTHIIHGFL